MSDFELACASMFFCNAAVFANNALSKLGAHEKPRVLNTHYGVIIQIVCQSAAIVGIVWVNIWMIRSIGFGETVLVYIVTAFGWMLFKNLLVYFFGRTLEYIMPTVGLWTSCTLFSVFNYISWMR